MSVICLYCGSGAALVSGISIYPSRTDLHSKQFWSCKPCDAYVGCHPGNADPLGRLANAELRRAKVAAHAAFDPLWKTGQMKRREAYAWLREALGIDAHECHVGMFDVEMCKAVVAACRGLR